MDKVLRIFNGEGYEDKRATVLLSWDSICQLKERGGLGVRKMNEVVLLKVT